MVLSIINIIHWITICVSSKYVHVSVDDTLCHIFALFYYIFCGEDSYNNFFPIYCTIYIYCPEVDYLL